MRFTLFLVVVVICLAIFGMSTRRTFHAIHHAKAATRLSRDRPDLGKTPMRREMREVPAKKRGGNIAPRQVQTPADTAAEPKAEKNPAWTVTGLGKTEPDAEQDALGKAQAELVSFFRQQNPPLEWTPSPTEIKNALVKEHHTVTKEFGEEVGRMQEVTLHVELTPEVRGVILQKERHYRMEQRLPLAAKILGGLLALLLATAGYIRLDEWSKGYYTRWLRLAAIGLVVAAVIVLFWDGLHAIVQSFLTGSFPAA